MEKVKMDKNEKGKRLINRLHIGALKVALKDSDLVLTIPF
jgi:hypothetical protein